MKIQGAWYPIVGCSYYSFGSAGLSEKSEEEPTIYDVCANDCMLWHLLTALFQ
jgi:hypothetical protein